MKFGLSLEMVNLHWQEPNRNRRESRYYWDELFSLIPAAGFEGIELPYEPKWDFGGRSGIPLSNRSVTIKYGGPAQFRDSLAKAGISQIIGVHFDPSLFVGDDMEHFFFPYRHFGEEAIRFAGEAGAVTATITPTPCRGILQHTMAKGENWDAWADTFIKKTAETLNALAETAKQSGVQLTVKNEYWSVVRGMDIDKLMGLLDGGVGYDLDTANLAIAGVDVADFIGQKKDRIGSVHFTDTAFVDDGEYYKAVNPEYPAGKATQVFRDIGQGSVDLRGAYAALNAAGYNGWVVCNNRQTRDNMRAMLRTRRFIDTTLNA